MRARLLVLTSLVLSGCSSRSLTIGPGGDLGPRDLAGAADLARAPDLGAVPCGGLKGLGCPDGWFCEFPGGTCFNDDFGICQPIPTACTDQAAPVCGCDQRTYSNDCVRRLAGVPLLHTGRCPSSSFACGAKTCRGDQICVQGCCGVPFCTPPAPDCQDAPPACAGHPTCACLNLGNGPSTQCTNGPGVFVQYFDCE
jgi:hypothetical protein